MRFLLPAFLAAVACAQDVAVLNSLRWRNIGPLRGGRSLAVAGSSARPLEYYFGATGGGLWKTTDGGTTWNPVSDAFFKTSSVGAVAVAQSNPDVVYAGMGETELRGNIIQGDGIYKSTDAGKTWTHVGLEKSMAIARIRIDPSNANLVYAAAFGDPHGRNPERGVFRSKDGGATWERILFRDEKTGAIDLAVDSHNSRVLYATLWQAFRTPYSLSSGGPGSGIFKSVDGGDHWTELTHNPGFPGGVIGKITVAIAADSSRLYALIEARDGGLFRSDDAGATWTLINNNHSLWQRAFYFHRVYADPAARDTVYVSNFELQRSTDGGRTFRVIPSPHSDHHDLWIAPNDSSRMIDSNDEGANISVSGGRTWTGHAFSTAQMYHVVTTKHVPYEVCGAQQDNTTLCVPSNGRGTSFYPVGGGESGYVAADPTNTNIFYAGSYGGYITRFDHSTNQRREINVWPEYPVGQSAEDLKERFQWTTPIVFSPVDPKILYTSSQHLFKTSNGGQTWTQISPDLTRHDPATLGPSGGPITHDQTGVETYGTIFSVAPSRLDVNLIWTGSDDGFVFVTRDGGKNWTNVTPPDLAPLTRISLIEASPHTPGTAYVAANRYQLADRAPYVFKTADFGHTWTKIVTGIPSTDFPRAIREDVVRRDLLYLGTEHGFYISYDGGGRWQPFRLNLPVTPVHDIVVERNDLVIATHGRGFYVLGNIGAIRQLNPEVTQSSVFLFKPADAIRSVTRAAIDYYLSAQPADLKLEILDPGGSVLRTFTGSAEAEQRSEASDDEGPPPPARTTPARKGLNRFTWDMRSAPSRDFPGLIMYQANVHGPLVPPGGYQVRLIANGKTLTQSFEVAKDPRLTGVSDGDLEEQYRFAREVQEKFSRTNDTVTRIRRIKSEVAERVERAKNTTVTDAGNRLSASLTEIEGHLYQYRNRATKDPLNFPPQLNNKLGSLLTLVESADAAPTDSSYVVFKQLSSSVDHEFAALADLLGRDLTAFNTALAGAKLPPVSAQ
ncbi:MAG TPA: hypothetical protein VNX18_23090 [Bryobacteraceae bacterium]|jgi:photosystem II stability/assembly factor-like uncharacterized protein|nr:hypothetical protein [Bryobacteraceae bacterium]